MRISLDVNQCNKVRSSLDVHQYNKNYNMLLQRHIFKRRVNCFFKALLRMDKKMGKVSRLARVEEVIVEVM